MPTWLCYDFAQQCCVVGDGLATDDTDVTMACQIITAVLKNCRKGGMVFASLFSVFGLHCQCKLLQTSPAGATKKCIQ